MDNVRKLITEADGYQPHLIAPEHGYRRLIESSLVCIKGPAEIAVDAVHSILKELVHKSVDETVVSVSLPNLMRDESKKATLKLVDMECCYLTNIHNTIYGILFNTIFGIFLDTIF
ncbi:hypothetical protein MKW94_007591, partial [Papaver nudicaule]|nr:hypothetical protein [Papaver nudicaule]